MNGHFRLEPDGPFDLDGSRRFLEGFPPAGQRVSADGPMVLVMLSDDWQTVAVQLSQESDGVHGRVTAGHARDDSVVRGQVERVLSLDVDGSGFAAVAAHDAALGTVAAQFAGLRPMLFATPYEAACWSVLSQRTRMSHAATVRTRLADVSGGGLVVDETRRHAFPSPEVLLSVEACAGVSAVKLARLQAVAAAALHGALDPVTLRRLPVDDALDLLQQIPGIGPFSAELILVRGAGAPDVFPTRERRLHAAMAEVYEVDDPTVDKLSQIADRWRPYRSWAALLLRTWWERNRR